MDSSLLRNLDTQHRRLDEIESAARALLDGAGTVRVPDVVPTGSGYDALTADNDRLRADRGWDGTDLGAALTSEQRDRFDDWRRRQRIPWEIDDVVAVGFAAALGFTATWFDAGLDRAVRARLGQLGDTELLRGWERDAKRLPIDYTGPGFGGPHHRVRSSGHDLARPVAALRQILDGKFRGSVYEHSVRHLVEKDGFRSADGLTEALVLWAKHLAADVVTGMSLPLPGWTWLAEAPNKALRTFANRAYHGVELGEGLNVRSGALTPTLAVLAVETVVRTHVHGRTLVRRDSPVLRPDEQAQRTELLLAAHALTGAASLGKTVARAFTVDYGPMALRHLNVPVLVRVGTLGLQVRSDARRRARSAAPSWAELHCDAWTADRLAGTPSLR